MSEEHLVEDWCFEIGLENEGWLDSGDFGNAYTISDEKVIKMTTDYNEFMQTFNIFKKESDYLPKIFGMRVFPNGEMGILMEELGTDPIDDLFSSWMMEADDIQNVDLLNIDLEDSFLTDEVVKMVKDVKKSIEHYKKNGVNHFDLNAGNIGLNNQGNYILFDQTEARANSYNEDLFADITEKLKDEYNIEEPIYKKNVPIERIVADLNSMQRTLRDISENKISQTDGAIECMYNENGNLQITDGYHRLCEALLKGETVIDVEIGLDERYGYSHPVYSLVRKGRCFRNG